MTMASAAGLAGCTSAPASVTVQSAENMGITVTSQEKIKAEPDIAEITYSVYSQAADASTCQSENQTDLDAVLALLKEKGIADTSVQTSDLGLNPIYDWDNGKKITGYEMTTEVVVSDVAIEDACRVEHYISDETFNALRKLCNHNKRSKYCNKSSG